MQITLMCHGKHLSNGHISREEIEECIGTGLLLGNAVIGKQLTPPQSDWQLDKTDSLCLSHFLPVEYHADVLAPDLILSSPALYTKETTFAFSEQLKQTGIKPEIQYNIAYLNDLVSANYKYDYNNITTDCLEKLCISDPIKKTIKCLQIKNNGLNYIWFILDFC